MGSILKGFGLHSSKRTGHRPTLFDRHPGQAIVLIAVLMIVLLGFTGLAVDGGELYFLQKNVQNAADAAVLSGLYEICSDPSRTLLEAHELAENNVVVAVEDNGFYDLDGIEAADMTDGVDITMTHPATPPGAGGPDANYLIVDITVVKPARLIQLVYQGPLQVSVRAAGKCTPVTEWTQGKAMFGVGACSAPKESVVFTGSSINIVGGVFGNGDVSLNASGSGDNIVDGGAGGAGTVDDHNKIDYTNPSTGQPASNQAQIPAPQFWNVNHFKPGGKTAEWAAGKSPVAYFYYSGSNATDWEDFDDGGYGNATSPPAQGIYYSAGDITLGVGDTNDEDLNGITLVAAGQISIQNNTNNLMVPFTVPFAEIVDAGYDVLPLAFTEHPQPGGPPDCDTGPSDDAINIGSQIAFLGVLYAPNGLCEFSGSDGQSSQGSIMCYTISLSGSNFSLTYDPDWFPPPPPSVGVTG